ncbi:unnamed protein product [Lepeophtheirus salmonis]|uniref:(salmon louse) hypothetical protein n=1 Tax=Lepeophtheirus salmonis TaxID=72036 RepID=A0A7R8H0W4_LEPSM|nr:unnamed protein product [Lepeophtheirus salmonis]CAF2798674.1 unnamed protein product [Lepeophtheirus salmonis]
MKEHGSQGFLLINSCNELFESTDTQRSAKKELLNHSSNKKMNTNNQIWNDLVVKGYSLHLPHNNNVSTSKLPENTIPSSKSSPINPILTDSLTTNKVKFAYNQDKQNLYIRRQHLYNGLIGECTSSVAPICEESLDEGTCEELEYRESLKDRINTILVQSRWAKNGRGASESPTPSNSSVVISSSMNKENFYDNDDPGDTQIASSSSANNQKGNTQETTSETQICKKSNEDPKENKDVTNDNSSNALHIADTLLQEDSSNKNDKLDDYVRKASGHVSAEVDQEILDLEKELSIPAKTNKNEDDEEGEDFWLLIPRTFSSQSSRFELPMELSLLNGISPIEYLSRYVSVSNSRRLLYDKVFVRHRSLKDGLLNDESIILALNEVFGGILGEELQSHLWTTLGVTIKPHLVSTFNFKQFSGIAALAERMFSSEFSTSNSPLPEPKSEIEIADFDRLLSKLEGGLS